MFSPHRVTRFLIRRNRRHLSGKYSSQTGCRSRNHITARTRNSMSRRRPRRLVTFITLCQMNIREVCSICF
ncbi:hypothetical protein K439DRAFT_31879 [Ramaria rubella]|nr:hypothetical protein K439DRAFT_31879 [Ramaria rubella]